MKRAALRLLRRLGAPALVLVSTAMLTVAVPAQSFQARLFDQDDGLQSLSVTDLAQDGRGYLWVATENGVFQYSGSHFEEFSRKEGLGEPAVYSLLVDRQGTLWAGTHNGLFWFEEGRFREVQYQGRSLRVGMNSMLAATSAGELIVQTRTATYSVERRSPDGSWNVIAYRQRHPSSPHFGDTNGIGVDADDHLLIGCDDAICVNGLTLGPRQGVPPDYYMSFFRARSGQIWARGRKHIVTWKSGDAKVHDVSAPFPAGAMTTVCRRFTEDSAGRILTPTAEGFASWDGRQWTETRTTSLGALHGATAVFADREGAVWLGTEGSGLLESLGYRQWNNYSSAEGLSSPVVSAIAADRAGQIWVGNNQAANLIGRGSSQVALSPLGRADAALIVRALAPTPDGGMWTGTLTGSLIHTSAAGRLDIRTSLDAYINRLLLDPPGTLWMATSAGLFSLQCEADKPCTAQPFAELAGKSVTGITSDRAGGLWLAGEHGLDHLLNGRLIHIAVAGQKQNFRLVAVAGDDQVWVAGEAPGFLRVRVHGGLGEVIETHTQPELLSDRLQFLETDLQGQLWAGTDRGVNVLAHGEVSGITTEDGLPSNDASAFLADGDGSVWIGTVQGIAHLLHPEAVLRRTPFSARIDQFVYADGTPAAQGQLRWNAGNTGVRFSALSFRENSSLIYHYQLLGYDMTPVSTRSSLASFPKLPPGQYTFRVVAEDPVHHVFSAPAQLTFRLIPPWQRFWLLYVAPALGGLILIAGVWRWRNRALLAQRTRLERLVEERTREIREMAVRDSLTGLLNRKAIMAKLEEEIEYARRYKTALCIALLDLDHFKQVNDTLGHLAGDEVLRQSAKRLAATIRSTDAVGRYGGEEFLILFRNVEQEFGMEHCERIRRQLCGEPIFFEGKELMVTTSIGVAWSREESEFTGGLIARADRAMYDAKANGRNRVEFAYPTGAFSEELSAPPS